MLDIGGSDAKKITLILLSLKNIFSLSQKILAPNLKRNALKLKKVQLRLSQMCLFNFFHQSVLAFVDNQIFFPKSVSMYVPILS